jgi:hypothetical protein
MKVSLKNMKFSRLTWIGMILVGVVLLGWIVALTTGVFDPPKKVGEKQADPNRCPFCNHPLTKYAKEDGHCLYCKAELPGSEKPSVIGSKVIPGMLIGLFVVLLTTNIVLTIRSIRRNAKQEADYFVTHCRKCGRKVRFREQQCGQIVKCPTCRQLMRFPEAPEKPRGVWTRMKGWLNVKGKKKVKQAAE